MSEHEPFTSEEPKNIEPPVEENKVWREIVGWIRDIGIALLIVLFIINFVGQKTSVVGKSMEPTLYDGDQLVIDMLSYRFGEVERFDIIVFPHEPKLFYIKRIIGLPGEHIEIVNGKVEVNGEVIDDAYGFDIIRQYGDSLPMDIPDNEYFVMGDNRNSSQDSRYTVVGTIEKEEIMGKAIVRVWPFSTFGALE